jgi:hypothetical protein
MSNVILPACIYLHIGSYIVIVVVWYFFYKSFSHKRCFVLNCDDMSTATFRRNGDRSVKTIPAICLRFRFPLIFFGLVLVLSILIFFPYDFLHKKSSNVGGSRSDRSKKVVEAMTDFRFVTDETKWIGPGRKTKRIHVVDKTNQVRFDRGKSLIVITINIISRLLWYCKWLILLLLKLITSYKYLGFYWPM